MKKFYLLTKTLLVAVCLLVGASNAWGAAGDVTTNVDINFSSFTGATGDATPSSITGTKGTMYFSGAYQVLDGTDYRLGMRNGANNISIASAEYADTKDIVTISFDIAFTQMANKDKEVYFKIQDSSNADIASFSLKTNSGSTGYVASLVNTLGVVAGDIVVDYSINWTHKVSFTITLNYATSKIITTTACSAATNTSSSHTTDMTNTNPVAKFVVGAGYNADAEKYRCQFDNLLIKTTEGDYSTNKTITLNFKDSEDNDISGLFTGTTEYIVDAGETFTPSDYYPVAMYDGDFKYTYTSGGDAFVVTTDQEVNLVYTKSARPTHTLTVTANYGSKNKTIVNGVSVQEAGEHTYYYPRHILDGTTLYEYASSTDTGASATYWTSTTTVGTENVSYALTYNAVPGECVYYSEGEDIPSKDGNYGWYASVSSNGTTGVLNNAEGNLVTSLAAGKYTITARTVGRGDGGIRYIFVYKSSVADANKLLTCTPSYTGNTQTSEAFELTAETNILVNNAPGGGQNGRGLDYIYIMKTGEVGTITPAGWASFSSSYPLDLSTISGGTAYYASASDGSSVTLTETTAKVPANTGLMIKGEPNAEFTIATTSDETTAIDGNLLKATDGSEIAASPASGAGTYHYVFGYKKPAEEVTEYGFYNLAAATTVPAGKAYLEITSNGARALRISLGGITEVENIEAEPEATVKKNGAYLENGKIAIYKNGMKFNANGQLIK